MKKVYSMTGCERRPEEEVLTGHRLWFLTYLLIGRGGVYDISHQNREEFGHSSNTSSKGSIGRRASKRLAGLACLIYPLSSYRVYDVEYSQLLISWRFLEMCINFLNEDGL